MNNPTVRRTSMKAHLFMAWGTVLMLALPLVAAEADPAALAWKAGAASVVITPQQPMYMAGYAARKEMAEGTEQELFAKALVIEDFQGQRAVIVTMDLIGVSEELRAAVAGPVAEKYQIESQSLLMNASHTHCGPAYGRDDAKEYFDWLSGTLVQLVGQALERLETASLSYCYARCGFAMNRRTPTDSGYRNHPNPDGPVDHTVPVLRVAGADGQLRAVLFGYACHNTTMGFLRWLGDYAGYAQEYLEQDHPGVIALFMAGCGADQNPYPRSRLEYAQRHGRSLATAVEAALEIGQTTPRHRREVRGPLRAALETVALEFTAEGLRKNGTGSEPKQRKPEQISCREGACPNFFTALEDRADHAYPVQVLRLGNDLVIVALGNEVVISSNAASKARVLGEKSSFFTKPAASFAPNSRSMPESSHSTDSGPL
jgi:neutral ceramidase